MADAPAPSAVFISYPHLAPRAICPQRSHSPVGRHTALARRRLEEAQYRTDLGHGFHQTKKRVHFTISEEARQDVLGRRLSLNHERYAEEERNGLHEKGGKGKKGAGGKGRNGQAEAATVRAPELFDMEA